jgi:hypothetical protein
MSFEDWKTESVEIMIDHGWAQEIIDFFDWDAAKIDYFSDGFSPSFMVADKEYISPPMIYLNKHK